MLFFEHTGNKGIRIGDWKLVNENGGEFELYDLAKDRGETKNLIKAHPEVAAKLETQWKDYAKEIGVVEWNSLPQSKRSPGPDYRKK